MDGQINDGSQPVAAAAPAASHAELTFGQKILVAAFLVAAVAYLGWRPGTFNPEAMLFSVLVYGAEVFGFCCALLYVFMCWRLTVRTPAGIPDWP